MSQPIDTLAIEIEANAAQSVDGVRKLSRALTSLSKSISSVNGAGIGNVASSLNSMSNAFGGVGTGSQSAASGTKKYSSTLPTLITHNNKAAHSAKSLAYYFGKFYANMFMVIRGVRAFGKTISGTMDYMESFNFWDVAISSATGKTNEWKELGYEDAETYAQAFKQGLADFNQKMTGFKTDANTGDISISNMPNLGINLTDLTTFQAEIVSVTSSLGLCTSVSKDTSKALSMLAADMSSLKNIDIDTVMTNFQSGLIGQSRSLYKYGIDITNATLQTYAYKYGIEKAVSEMTQAEKMQLRMLAILDQSKVAWGDLANTLEQPSNQFRVLKNGVKNLAITIGKLLMPMVSATLPYLNAMVNALQRFFTWTANILGIELNVDNTGTGTSDIFDDIEDSAEDATDAVKKLKNSIRSFDELNVINTNTGISSNNSIGGGVDLSTEISNALAEYEKAWEEAYANMNDKASALTDALVDAFKRKDYKSIGTYISNGITNALNSINWDTVYSVADQFGSGLAQFLNGLITPEEFEAIGKTVAGALNTVIQSTLAFGKSLDWENVGESLGNGTNSFFEEFDFVAFSEMLNVWVDGLEILIGKALQTLDWEEVLGSVANFLETMEFDTAAVVISALVIKKIGKVTIENAIKEFVATKIGIALAGLGTITLPELTIAFSTFAIGSNGMGTPGFDVFANWILTGIDEALTNLLPDWLSEFFGKFVAGFSLTGAVTGNPLAGLIGGLFATAPETLFNFDWALSWFDEAKRAFENAFEADNFMDIGGWILEGILDGFVGALVFITEPFTDLFQWVWDSICDVFDINSPAEEMKPLGEYILLGVIGGFSDTIQEFTDVINKWYEESVEPWFDFENWNFKGVKEGLSSAWNSAVDAVKQIWNNFASWLNRKLTINIDTSSIIGQGISAVLGTDTITLGKLPTFANGGVTSADIFAANENGVPELIGTIGRKSAIASGTEVTGIADAVYSTASEEIALLRQQNELLRLLLEKPGLDNGDIFRAVKSEYRQEANRLGAKGNPAAVWG